MLDELNTYTLQELYKQPIEPIPWVVEDLLAPGLYFLGGSPKVGKSWLALQLCLAVCRGEPFLGFETKRTEVLYISLEDGPRRLHIRALRLTEEAPAGLHLCSHAHLIGHGLEQQLDQMLAEHPAIKLVIIDTLQKIREATGASPSYSIDYRDASALKAVADRNDICMVVVHHLRKQEDKDPFKQLSGTNGLNGAADGSIVLDRRKRQEGTAYDVSHRTGYRRYGTDAGLFRLPLEPRLLTGAAADASAPVRSAAFVGRQAVFRYCHRIDSPAGGRGKLMGACSAVPVSAEP